MSYLIAVAQMCSSENPDKNLPKISRWVRAAKKKGARLIAFPENSAILTENRKKLVRFAHDRSAEVFKQFKALSKENRIWIHTGSFPCKSASAVKLHNRSFLISPDGRTTVHYNKIHLFDVSLSKSVSHYESKRFLAGEKIKRTKTPLGLMGFSICYDLRFPELYRRMTPSEIVFAPSAFTVPTGEAHWDVLTRARAIENQCYLIAAAQGGRHDSGRKTYGHSRVIDPWGEVISQKARGEGLIYAKIDLAQLRSIRKKLPALNHRRV